MFQTPEGHGLTVMRLLIYQAANVRSWGDTVYLISLWTDTNCNKLCGFLFTACSLLGELKWHEKWNEQEKKKRFLEWKCPPPQADILPWSGTSRRLRGSSWKMGKSRCERSVAKWLTCGNELSDLKHKIFLMLLIYYPHHVCGGLSEGSGALVWSVARGSCGGQGWQARLWWTCGVG